MDVTKDSSIVMKCHENRLYEGLEVRLCFLLMANNLALLSFSLFSQVTVSNSRAVLHATVTWEKCFWPFAFLLYLSSNKISGHETCNQPPAIYG